jgi:hypothetical protein
MSVGIWVGFLRLWRGRLRLSALTGAALHRESWKGLFLLRACSVRDTLVLSLVTWEWWTGLLANG